MQNLYYLTEEDVKPELLPKELLKKLKEDFNRKRSEIFDNELMPLYRRISEKQDALLDKYAREAGFADYKEVENARSLSVEEAPETRIRLRKFNQLMNCAEYKALFDERNKESDKVDEKTQELYQDYFYKIFKYTRPMMETTDFKNHPILPPQEWLQAWQAEYDAEMLKLAGKDQHADKWLPDYIRAEHTYCMGNWDETLLKMKEEMENVGWVVISASSGLVIDHPYERYLSDDPQGTYKAGDHMFWGSQAPETSLRLDARGYDLDKVQKAAAEAGFRMTVDTTHGHDVCELTLPATRDGSTMYELIRHFTENVRKTGEEPFGKTLWLLRQQYPQVWSETLEAHGGWSLYSDRMVIDRLNSLSNSLVNKVEELRTIDYDEIISRIPVEQVDMDKLLRKYTALLVDVYGKDKTLDLLKDIVQNPEERKQVVEESQNRPMVMMNKYNGQVEMGMSDLFEDMGWLDNPNYLDITGRLTDIHIYRSVRPDDPHRIRCKVDGVQQVSVLLTPAQDRYWQGARLHDMCVQARYKLAGETFSSLLLGKEQQQQRSEGFKR